MTTEKTSTVQKQMEDVVRKKMEVMTNKQWVLQWGPISVNVRKQVERIVKVVQIFADLASRAASLDPLHAGLAWAGICVILPVSDPGQSLLRILICVAHC